MKMCHPFKCCRCKQEKTTELALPPGYDFTVGQVHTETSKDNDPNHLIIKKSWDLALGPLKQASLLLININAFKILAGLPSKLSGIRLVILPLDTNSHLC